VAVAIAVMWLTSCSKEPLVDDRIRDMPRRFVVGGRGYLISEQEAGIVEDDAVAYTADAGARSFDYQTRTVLRHLFVGRWENFDALPADERSEIKTIASAALDYIRRLEIRQHYLSAVDKQHREILKAFLAAPAGAQAGIIGRQVVVRVLRVYDPPNAWSDRTLSAQRLEVTVISTEIQELSPGQTLQVGVYALKGSTLFEKDAPRLSRKTVRPGRLLAIRIAPGCIWPRDLKDILIHPICVAPAK